MSAFTWFLANVTSQGLGLPDGSPNLKRYGADR